MNGNRATPLAPTLFDPRTTEKPRCPSCGTTAKNLCQHDADRAHGTGEYTKRPRGCLASAQLSPDEELPF